MTIQKYSGAGNKFVMIDNLDNKVSLYRDIVSEHVTANPEVDGVIFLETSVAADYKMNYFNKDGTGDSLCGNGLRCTYEFITDNGICRNDSMNIEAVSKIYLCKKVSGQQISVKFPPPEKVKINFKLKVHFAEWWQLINCSYVDCGSPHAVIFLNDIEKPGIKELEEVKILEWGRNIRMHKDFMPEGVNVNFVKIISKTNSEIEIRSYERGVEGETLACGTGAVSSALVFCIIENQIKPVKVLTKSGEFLTVEFAIEDKKIKSIGLTGEAHRYK